MSGCAYNTLAQSSTTVSIVPPTATLDVGKTIELLVQVENVNQLSGAELSLVFDPTILEVVDANPTMPETQIAPGDFLQPGDDTINAVQNGLIEYGVKQKRSGAPVSGSGVLAKITFKGKAAGTSNIAFIDVLLTDHNDYPIRGTPVNGKLTVIGASVTEAPASQEDLPTYTPTAVAPTATPSPPTPTPHQPSPTASTAPRPACLTASVGGYDCTTIQGYHVVQRDETVYAIARAYSTDPCAIVTCNYLTNPRLIHRGNMLAIPYAPWSPPPGPTAQRQFIPSLMPAPAPTPEPGCKTYYTVQPHETLLAIGLRYNVNIWDIARANRIYNLNLIHAGQVLCIP